MPLLADRVRETSATTGTGTLTLAGAVAGYQGFNAAFANADTVYYVIHYATEWEVGIGTVGTGTLSRDSVLSSSNADALVPFSAGTKDVFCAYVADRAVTTSDAATLTNKTIDGSANTLSNIPNAATTAASANTPSAIVARDASGNFAAGTVTAALTGNASTATTLQTARNINGVSFNGSADITVTAAAGTLSGSTLASGVTASSLTSVGTLTSLAVSGAATVGTTLGVTGVTTIAAGTAALPALTTTGDTNTGFLFPAADTIALSTGGTERARIDASGNVGIGVTPSAWGTYRAIQLGATASAVIDSSGGFGTNYYFDGTNYRYVSTSSAALYSAATGQHRWYVAASGTAGTAISLTQAMTLNASGNLGIGTASPGTRLHVDAGSGQEYFRGAGNSGAARYLNILASTTTNAGDTHTITATSATGVLAFGAGGTERWRINASGHFLAGVDNTYDIGASGATRPRDVFVGRRAVIDGITVGRGGQTTVSTNTAVGNGALNSASLTGGNNVAVGASALLNNTTASSNIAVGTSALATNTTGNSNIAVGTSAMTRNTTGNNNVAVGQSAMLANTTGASNSAVGALALFNNTTGASNSAFGREALRRIAGSNNVAVGFESGVAISRSVATLGAIVGGSLYTNGTYSGVSLTLSSGSVFDAAPTADITVSGGAVTVVTLVTGGSGFQSTDTVLTAAAASIGGTGSGFTVAVATLTGAVSSNNTLLGYQAANTQTEGSSNIAIGSGVQLDSLTGSNQINIGTRYFHDRIRLLERATDPAKPAEGNVVLWMSDGAGLGDDGDVLIGSTAGGVTNYAILFDHSAGTLWP
jgi:hypothetical protein